jgi:hypothetical protein
LPSFEIVPSPEARVVFDILDAEVALLRERGG